MITIVEEDKQEENVESYKKWKNKKTFFINKQGNITNKQKKKNQNLFESPKQTLFQFFKDAFLPEGIHQSIYSQ